MIGLLINNKAVLISREGLEIRICLFPEGVTLPTADSWYRKPSPRLCPVCINIDISPEMAAQSAQQTKHFVSPQRRVRWGLNDKYLKILGIEKYQTF